VNDMKKAESQQKDEAIDRLLSHAFKDDLPSALEIRLQKRIQQFPENLAQIRPRTGLPRILPQVALAAGALLMVLAGGFLQAKRPQTQLMENLSLVQTSLHVSYQIENSNSLLCSGEIHTENGDTQEYVFRWLSSGSTRLDIQTPQKDILKTYWISEAGITLSDFTQEVTQEFNHQEQLPDPFVLPLLALISPGNLAEILYGEWQLQNRWQEGPCEWRTYTIFPTRAETALDMTLDFCSLLPVEIQKTTTFPLDSSGGEKANLKIKFQWNTPIESYLMQPASGKMKKNV
jgi:hypothetical protein